MRCKIVYTGDACCPFKAPTRLPYSPEAFLSDATFLSDGNVSLDAAAGENTVITIMAKSPKTKKKKTIEFAINVAPRVTAFFFSAVIASFGRIDLFLITVSGNGKLPSATKVDKLLQGIVLISTRRFLL